jgi:isoamylase
MTGDDWGDWNNRALGMLIYGDATDETDDRGRPVKGDTMLLLLNASEGEVTFTLPTINGGQGIWAEMIDTTHRELQVVTSGTVTVDPFAIVLLRYGENRRVATEPSRR